MTRLWYRHWLELRPAFRWCVVLAVVQILFYPMGLHGLGTFLDETGTLARELRELQPAADHVPLTLVVPWGLHVNFVSFVVLLLPPCLYGSGLGTKAPWPRLPQDTSDLLLSLPVSRVDVVVTRWAAGCGLAAALVAVLLVANAAIALLTSRPVPLWLMTLASLRALVLMSAMLSCLGMFAAVLGERTAAVVISIGLLIGLLSYPAWSLQTKQFVAGATWLRLGVAMAITISCTAIAVIVARERDTP